MGLTGQPGPGIVGSRNRENLTSRNAITIAALAASLFATIGYGQYVEDSIYIGRRWVRSLVYNDRAGVVYGASEEGRFFVIDCATNRRVVTLALSHPVDIAYNRTMNKAYVVSVQTTTSDSVVVIDGTSHEPIATIPVLWANRIVWDSMANRVYVACTEDNRVAVIDCVRDSVIADIAVGSEPEGMHINNQYRKLYVQNYFGESVSIVDLATLQVIQTIRLNNVPGAGYYCERTGTYFCGQTGLVLIDGASDTVVSHISLPSGVVNDITADLDESLLFVGVFVGTRDTVFSLDPSSRTLTSSLQVGGVPEALLWSASSEMLYCACSGWNQVLVLSADGSQILRDLDVGYYPRLLCRAAGHARLYVGHLGSDYLYVLRDTAAAVCERRDRPSFRPCRLAAAPNPFRSQTEVYIPRGSTRSERIEVYSADGRAVATLQLVSLWREERVGTWDGRDGEGRVVGPGVYVARVVGQSDMRVRMLKLE